MSCLSALIVHYTPVCEEDDNKLGIPTTRSASCGQSAGGSNQLGVSSRTLTFLGGAAAVIGHGLLLIIIAVVLLLILIEEGRCIFVYYY